uniref:TRAF-type domain-containing protein n=1 Tax=Arcella intermedia TaxID=1963864 RepID=A0A6B2L5N0_9EUKA
MEELKTQFVITNARLQTEFKSSYTLEEALTSIEGFYESFLCIPPIVDDFNVSMGGKIELPSSALSKIVSLPNVNFPLVFELMNISKSKSTHVGVLQFNTENPVAVVPSWIMENLEATKGDIINVKLVTLPKGQLVRLQPMESEFIMREDYKSILESILRSYSALTVGDQLHIFHEEKAYRFIVLGVEGTNSNNQNEIYHSIDIHNTDLEIDFFIPENLQHTTETEPQPNPTTPNPQETGGIKLSTATADADLQTQICDNCLKHVPISTFQRHQLFCLRNNILCKKCNAVHLKSQIEQHNMEVHQEVPCVCGEMIEKFLLSTHKQNSCSHRLKSCKFCKVRFKVKDLKDHLAYCGSRTSQCKKCSRLIMLKDLKQHKQSNCSFPPITTPPRQPSLSDSISSILQFFSWN